MPVQVTARQFCTDRFSLLEENVRRLQAKGRVILLGDFNARVGKSNRCR